MPTPASNKRRREEETADEEKRISKEDETVVPELSEDAKAELAEEKRQEQFKQKRGCPYLDTVNRSVLDFDFEKVCSVSLSNVNVYGCLVCGKYFQGRGRGTHAYFHSLQANHHVFLNLANEKAFCLPDGYEILDPSLDDVKYLLNPTFVPTSLAALDTSTGYSRASDGSTYLPGIVGLNNVRRTDYINVAIQSLVRIAPLRDYFMIEANYTKHTKSLLVARFGELVRKMWNPRNCKGQVSPHELLQAVSLASNKKFKFDSTSDAADFITWFVNKLHTELGGTREPGSSIIHKIFQGELVVRTERPIRKFNKQTNEALPPEKVQYEVSEVTTNFLTLTVEVPATPLFKDKEATNIIPQIPLYTILKKFDGETKTELITGERKTYLLTKLPPFLLLFVKRFTKNNFFVEKNPTIVNFPVRNLELRDYTTARLPLEGHPVPTATKYDLLANVVHEGKPEDGQYRMHLLHQALGSWFEIQDLHVSETMPQLVALSEAFYQVYQLQPSTAPGP